MSPDRHEICADQKVVPLPSSSAIVSAGAQSTRTWPEDNKLALPWPGQYAPTGHSSTKSAILSVTLKRIARVPASGSSPLSQTSRLSGDSAVTSCCCSKPKSAIPALETRSTVDVRTEWLGSPTKIQEISPKFGSLGVTHQVNQRALKARRQRDTACAVDCNRVCM